jgi:hypothetical protein
VHAVEETASAKAGKRDNKAHVAPVPWTKAAQLASKRQKMAQTAGSAVLASVAVVALAMAAVAIVVKRARVEFAEEETDTLIPTEMVNGRTISL